MKNTINTRILAIAFTAIFSLAVVVPALANDNEKKAIPVELKFIGNIDNKPVFQLSFNNEESNEFIVTVRDEFNNVLYKDVVKGEKNSRKFMLNTEELGDTAVSFEITGKKSDLAVTYEVNKKSRLVQDVVINKK